MRITAQLLEAETAAHLWADRYEGKLEDVFDLQDQITEKVVGVVQPSVRQSEIERSRRKRPENLDAYDLYLRALPHMMSVMPADARIAAGFLEDALSWIRTTPPPTLSSPGAMRFASCAGGATRPTK